MNDLALDTFFFSNPEYGWLFVLPIMFAIYVFRNGSFDRKLEGLNIHPLAKYRLTRFFSINKIFFKQFLLLTAMFLFPFALMEPKWGQEQVSTILTKADVVIALDISTSMTARDISPSRLNRAKIEIEKLLQSLSGQRVSLIAFAGSSKTLIPFTLDYNTISTVVQSLSPLSTTRQGSSLLPLLRSASLLFEESPVKNSGFLVIFGDGEFHEKENESMIEREIEKIKSQNISVFSYIIGTEEGAEINPGFTSIQNSLVDNKLRVSTVRTKAQINTLKNVSDKTGGNVSIIDDLDIGNPSSYDFVFFVDQNIKSTSTYSYKDKTRFYWFVFPIFFILLLESIIPSQKIHSQQSRKIRFRKKSIISTKKIEGTKQARH